jgi:hypothetical protein
MDSIEIGKNCKVSYIQDLKCVKVEWLGRPSSDEFRLGCNTALDLLKLNGVSKMLVDNSGATLFSVSDQHWLNNEWFPKAEKAGYRYSATILGDSDAFVKYAAQSIASKRDQSKFTGKFFKSIEEASDWLKNI